MLEPTTISIPNLAVRWNQTPADILEYAANLRLHLLFNFDGLVFDFNDDWLPIGKDWRERREFEALTDFVKRADAQFKRRRNGQLSQWESLDSDEAVSLRAEVTARNQAIEIMNGMFDERDRKRQQKHYRGALMALPATVDELLRLGFAKHPIQAYRPEGPVVRLEPARAQWKERLEPADMLVSMADVKAIEAATKPQQTAPAIDTAPPAPVEAVGASDDVEPKSNLPWWQLAYDIHDMAQNIGAKFHSEQKRTSNAAIARAIETRINDIERSKGRSRKAPNHDTIRGLLTGRVWRPE